MKISADFTKITGKIKPMHAVGQPPLSLWRVTDEYMHFLGEAGIPFSRLHDTGGRYGAGVYVDIPNIFHDFDADENDPFSYDFRSTDKLLQYITAQGTQVYYRLGVTIENDHALASYRVFPPKDPEKWARICEHIIAHYNEGWKDGFHLGIRYWEIWNEPDDCVPTAMSSMWIGKPQEYYNLYCVTAKHLKAVFGDTIKVGGYASCGFYKWQSDPDGTGLPEDITVVLPDGTLGLKEGYVREHYFIQFFHEFLRAVKKAGAPLDFFSWHSYSSVPNVIPMAGYVDKVLEYEGFGGTEHLCNEWNTCHDERKGTSYASANVLAMMLGMQKTSVSMMNFYDASMGLMSYSGLFNAETHCPLPTYFTFMAFNHLYRLQNEIETATEGDPLYVGGATDGTEKVLLIANRSEKAVTAELDIAGASTDGAEILRIDGVYTYSPTGKRVVDGKLLLPAWSCTEIRMK